MSFIIKSSFISPLLFEKMKLRFKKIIFLTVTWIFAGLFYIINQLSPSKFDFETGFTNKPVKGNAVLITILISTTIAGIITGIFEAFISERKQHKLPLGKMIAYSTAFYLALYFTLFIIGVHSYKMYITPRQIDMMQILLEVKNYFLSAQFLLSFFTFGIFVLFSLFLLHAREKFGFGTLRSFLSGRYFYPKEEDRIFMFLDIKSATSIAEKLGALKYHQFLNDFFKEITYPILYKEGEIYQYVGDEITISWTEKNGLKNLNCIECFFEIQKTVKESSGLFLEKYGIIPEFKAGLHIGKIVTGEIGIIKREIVYSGDTLNTASRIQELCNHFNAKMLMSKELINKIPNLNKYSISSMGECRLRGKQGTTELYGISN